MNHREQIASSGSLIGLLFHLQITFALANTLPTVNAASMTSPAQSSSAPSLEEKAKDIPVVKLQTQIKTKLSWAPLEFLEKGYRNAPWVSDPFYPNARGMVLSGMISDDMAFINGRWFKIGEDVSGYKIKSIKPDGVTLIRRNELLLLKMR